MFFITVGRLVATPERQSGLNNDIEFRLINIRDKIQDIQRHEDTQVIMMMMMMTRGQPSDHDDEDDDHDDDHDDDK